MMYRPYAVSLAILLFLAMPSPTPGFAQNINLPDIGDSAAGVMTPEEEHRTGLAIIRNIRRAGGLIEDPLANQYLNQLGYQLVSHSNTSYKKFSFFIINDPDINAFALPGGFIGVNYGLILAGHAESELASVLAHEIAHVTQRHHARAYNLASQSNIPVVAAIIAAIVLGSQDSQVGEAAMASLAASSIQQKIDFTRENEKEADHIGIGLLSDAGFDPFSMADFFDTLQRQTRLYGPQAPEFLRTHPVNENRVADAKNRAADFPRATLKNEFNYHLIKNRLQVLTRYNISSTDLQNNFKKNLKLGYYANKSAKQYGYVLALMQNEQYKTARKLLNTLLKQEPLRIAYQLASAELYNLSGNKQASLEIYKKALSLNPGNEAVTLPYAQTLLEMKRAEQVKKIITPLLGKENTNPRFYQLLAQAENQLHHAVNQHEALAEYYFNIGQTHQALTQLNLALKEKTADFYQRSRIEARQKMLREILREEAQAASKTNG